MWLFFVLAPISVPIYLLFVAGTNLLGAANYIVIEATLARILKRPVSLTTGQIAIFAIPILIAAPFAAAAHFLLAVGRGIGRGLCAVGHWQTGLTSRAWTFGIGTLWFAAALWTTMMCFNAAMAMGWIGMGVSTQTRNQFIDCIRRDLFMDELPKDMQQRRERVIAELGEHQSRLSPGWDIIQRAVSNDAFPFRQLNRYSGVAMRKIAGLPWYFIPKELAPDGLDHSVLLLGPLLFCWMLLVRWPGTFAVLRFRLVHVAWCAARLIVVVAAMYGIGTWVPLTVDDTLWLNGEHPGVFVQYFSPAAWFGATYLQYAEPEWYLFNLGLWLVLICVVAFVWWTAWRASPFVGWPRYYIAFLASRLLQRKRIAFFSVGAVTLCVAMMVIVISVMGGFVDSIRDRANSLLGDLVLDGSMQGFPFYEEFIAEVKKLRDEKTGEPLVVEATPLIYSYGILQVPALSKTKAVRIWGIKLDEYVRVNQFGKDLFYNNRYGDTRLDEPRAQPTWGYDATTRRAVLPEELDRWYFEKYLASLPLQEREEEIRKHPRDAGRFAGPGVFVQSSDEALKPGYEGSPYPGVIIGRDILFTRLPSGEYRRPFDHPRGELCLLTVLPLTRSGQIIQQAPPQPAFRYVDDSKTGIHEIDSMNVYVDFSLLQGFMKMNAQEREEGGFTSPRCNQMQIKLRPQFAWPRDVLLRNKAIVQRCWTEVTGNLPADPFEARMLSNVSIETWEEMQAGFIAAIEKEKFLVLIMFGVISIVAVLLILCIFYMIVQEKTRDIGIIKSVGASAEGVVAVFLVYGAAIGLVGAILGGLLGTTFVEHINEVQDWLARINPAWRVWSPDTYSFDKIPSHWKWSELLWISGLAILASIVGAAVPAIRAGRTWPVEALRYE